MRRLRISTHGIVELTVDKLIVELLRVFEKFGLNELRLAFDFAFAFAFGGLLDAFACGRFQLTEIGNDALSGPVGGAVRLHGLLRWWQQARYASFFPFDFLQHDLMNMPGQSSENFILSKKLFFTTSRLEIFDGDFDPIPGFLPRIARFPRHSPLKWTSPGQLGKKNFFQNSAQAARTVELGVVWTTFCVPE